MAKFETWMHLSSLILAEKVIWAAGLVFLPSFVGRIVLLAPRSPAGFMREELPQMMP